MVKIIIAILIFIFLRRLVRVSYNDKMHKSNSARDYKNNAVDQSDIQDADFEELG